MFGFTREHNHHVRRYDGRAAYKQVAVTPEAHAKLKKLAEKQHSSIIDTFDRIINV